MLKNTPKILSALFLLVFALQLVLVVGFAFYPAETQATTFDPQIDIGAGVSEIGANSIGQYIKAIYNYAIGVVGILATVVMMIGGIVWITAGGNQTRISEAKAWIGASLTGLVLALASYTLLSMINPNLVEFQPIDVDRVGELDNSLDLDGNPYASTTIAEKEGIPGVCIKAGGSCLMSTAVCCGTLECKDGICQGSLFNECLSKSNGTPCTLGSNTKAWCWNEECRDCQAQNMKCSSIFTCCSPLNCKLSLSGYKCKP